MTAAEQSDLVFAREVLINERNHAVMDAYRARCISAIATIDALLGDVRPSAIDEAPEAL